MAKGRKAEVVVDAGVLTALLGVATEHVAEYVTAGMPGPDTSGRFNAIECLSWWRSRLPAELASSELRVARLKIEIEMAELTLAERTGHALSRADAFRQVRGVCLSVRDELLSLGRRLASASTLAAPLDQVPAIEMVCEALIWAWGYWKTDADIHHWRAERGAAVKAEWKTLDDVTRWCQAHRDVHWKRKSDQEGT